MMRKAKNEGEGNRTADRRYRKAAADYAASGAAEEAARKAERALEGDEREELVKAESAGKAGNKAARKIGAQKHH